MANLFPESMNFEITDIVESDSENIENFKKTYAFDFEKGDFIRDPDGKIAIVNKLEAYQQWCQKALLTERERYLAYTHLYGQEYSSLIGRGLSKAAIELEVKRMTADALMVHPYSKQVENFIFEWNESKNALCFTFDVITVLDELFTLEHTQEMR